MNISERALVLMMAAAATVILGLYFAAVIHRAIALATVGLFQ